MVPMKTLPYLIITRGPSCQKVNRMIAPCMSHAGQFIWGLAHSSLLHRLRLKSKDLDDKVAHTRTKTCRSLLQSNMPMQHCQESPQGQNMQQCTI